MNAAAKTEADRNALSLAMALTPAIGLFMSVIKVGAYLPTGSAATLRDTADHVINPTDLLGTWCVIASGPGLISALFSVI